MKPYEKAQTIRLDESLDRRIRVTESQKEEIRKLYAVGNTSHSKLAKMYGCSKALIGMIVNPERAKSVSERFKANWRKYAERRGKEYHAAQVRHTRRYKYRLYKDGILKEEEQ